jgi:hypothetical protein
MAEEEKAYEPLLSEHGTSSGQRISQRYERTKSRRRMSSMQSTFIAQQNALHSFKSSISNRIAHWCHRIMFLCYVALSPLAFRYLLSDFTSESGGSYSSFHEQQVSLLVPFTSTICPTCAYPSSHGTDLAALTLPYISFTYSNLSFPNEDDNQPPAYWIFASLDFHNWFSAFTPASSHSNYFTDYEGQILVPKSQLSCLGASPGNLYVVLCLTDKSLNLELGEPVQGPPFNDRCFTTVGVCGRTCGSLGRLRHTKLYAHAICRARILSTESVSVV